MMIELKVPDVGESITEVEIGSWLKAEGATVAKDEPVAVLETEKATVDLPAPEAGVLVKVLKQAGDTAAVGEIIAHLETGKTAAATTAAPPPPPTAEKSSAAPARGTPAGKPVLAEPAARVEAVQPVEPAPKAAAPAPAAVAAKAVPPPPAAARPGAPARAEEVVRMTLLRRTIARRLVEAQHTAALLTTFNEVDMSAVLALRQQFQDGFVKKYGVKLGFMSFFVKAVIDGLKQFPALNAEIRDTDMVYHKYHDIGLAVGTDRGLVVPVLPDADRLSFAEIEQAVADFARRAREGRLKPEELAGGTFTITNGGVYGSLLSTPLVNPPQSGVLGMHAIQDRPVAVAGQVVIRPMMYVALSYDHRMVDGKEAILFLRRVKEVLENPARMFLEV
jgi:2-oxoglutarate dehydrogenase E2 component (dihydrolipoamide succinyltransferase)